MGDTRCLNMDALPELQKTRPLVAGMSAPTASARPADVVWKMQTECTAWGRGRAHCSSKPGRIHHASYPFRLKKHVFLFAKLDKHNPVDALAVWPFEGLSPDEVVGHYGGRMMLLATLPRQEDAHMLADLRNQHGLKTLCVNSPQRPDIAAETAVAHILFALIQ